MFSYVIGVEDIEASKIIDYLYDKYFYVDFIENPTFLASQIYIDPMSHEMLEDKEKSFWHLTTREHKYTVRNGNQFVTHKERLLDINRADRLEWIKKMIENHSDSRIKLFYKKESKHGNPIRLYLWAYQEDFVVILQKLGKSDSFLVTSFYITHDDKRDDYESYYDDYCCGTNPDLVGCEWF